MSSDPVTVESFAKSSAIFKNSYIFTNRNDPDYYPLLSRYIKPLPGHQLWFAQAPGQYVAGYRQYDRHKLLQHYDLSLHWSDLIADLKLSAHGTKTAQMLVFVHGLGNDWPDAVTGFADFGHQLQVSGGYRGLVVGFSWPSYGVTDSARYYSPENTVDPSKPEETIRGMIGNSVKSFATLLLAFIDVRGQLARDGYTLVLSIATHSEGNYMLMKGFEVFATGPRPAGWSNFRNSLMLAADISAISLGDGFKGKDIPKYCDTVSVYYSGSDSVLATSTFEYFESHEKLYPTRLGQIGPFGYPIPGGHIASNVVGVDCTTVNNNTNSSYVYDPAVAHSNYMSMPVILKDMNAVLNGTPPTGRAQYPGQDKPDYYLVRDPD